MDGSQNVTGAAPGFIKFRGLKVPRAPFMGGALRTALRKDTYETPMIRAASRTALPIDRVLDLGAGIGALAAVLAKREGVEAVHCIEGNPELAAYMPTLFAANDIENAAVTHGTLGKRKGTTDFHLRKNVALSSTREVEGIATTETVKIDVINAKTLFKDVAPTLLVCDIEGSEAEIIPQLDLKDLRAAVIKLHPNWIGPEGVNAVFAAMMDAGLAYNARASDGKIVSFRRAWPLK